MKINLESTLPCETIHYLWIGNPTKNDTKAIAGHDVAGPIEMARKIAKQNSQELIKFWCLEEYKEFYLCQFLAENVEIKVCSIEELLTEELYGELKEEAHIFQNLLPNILKNVEERVTFKDGFSLFLLASQGGVFFDTNIFPVESTLFDLKNITQFKQVQTALSPDGNHDFFMMYSPKPGEPVMREVLTKWLKKPTFANLSVFNGISQQIPMIPLFSMYDMGFFKVSYKSYFLKSREFRGLFYWVAHPKFETMINYGDVNQTCHFPYSIKLLEECSLFQAYNRLRFGIEMSEVDFLKLPFDTNIAYVASGNKVTYVNKQTKKCIVVENEWSSLMDVFPRDFGRITRLTPQSSYKVLGWILNPNCKIPHIINVDNCTLIHYAVFINNTNHIKALLKAGAQLDIKASYEIVSYDPSYTEIIKQFTPLELAEFLDHKDAVELLNKALSVKNTDPLLGLGSANQGFFYHNIDKKENNLPIAQDFEI